MQQIATTKDAYAECELPLALGVSRRAAARIAKQLGVKIGGRRIIARTKLLEWLEAQAPTSQARHVDPTLEGAREFRLR